MKKSLTVLLSCLLLASCNNSAISSDSSSLNSENLTSNSETTSSSTSSNSQESSSESSPLSSENSSSSASEDVQNTPYYKERNVTNFLGEDADVYRINITTENSAFPEDKENYINGSLNITQQDTSKVLLDSQTMRVKLRGNSTMAAAKKPFKIKFDEKQSLFGLEKAKEWVLLANYYDRSNIRNYLAYLTANKMTNLDFQPSSIFVDVYFNNEYLGLYLLSEQMEVKKGRVDIEDNVSKDGISSFMLEVDDRAPQEYEGYEDYCYLTFPDARYNIGFKFPDPDDYVEALETLELDSATEKDKQEANDIVASFNKNVPWLKNYLSNIFNNVIFNSDERYGDYIDVNSFIDYYLVEEFFKNVDIASTSQYYVIDQADEIVKLKAGPVWDFDIASGVVAKDSPDGVYQFYSNSSLFARDRDPFFGSLFHRDSFKDKVCQRYTELRDDVFAKVFDELDLVKTTLAKAQDRNLKRWPYTVNRTPTNFIEASAMSEYYLNIATLDNHYDYLEKFLQNQMKIMDEEYLIK